MKITRAEAALIQTLMCYCHTNAEDIPAFTSLQDKLLENDIDYDEYEIEFEREKKSDIYEMKTLNKEKRMIQIVVSRKQDF